MKQRLLATFVVAAIAALAAPAIGQSTSPEPVASPVPAASAVLPSNVPDPTASPQPATSPGPDASPSPAKAPLSKRVLHGMVKSLKGTKAVLRLADGTMQTFSVSAQTAALLKKQLGKYAVYRVVDGVLTLAPAP